MPFYSAIIRNAFVIDGRGSAAKKADVGLEGDRISGVGDLSDERAETEIDADGLYLAPGFIDLTGHSDTRWSLFDYPMQESLLFQGITTIIGGSCGESLAPLARPDDIEGIGVRIEKSSININWQSVSEFLTELEKRDLGLNFGTLVGHGILRAASGVDANRQASGEEIDRMVYLLNQSFEAGAFGLSFSLGRSRALMSGDAELHRLMEELKKRERPAFHHLSNEGADIISSVSKFVALSRESGASGHISHFKVLGKKSWPNQKQVFEIMDRAREDGLSLTMDVFPYTATGSSLYLLLPSWALEGDKEAVLKKLKNEKERKEIIEALKSLTLHYDRIIVASSRLDSGSAGRSLKELADGAGMAPEEMFIEILVANGLEVEIFNETISEENMNAAVLKDYAAISSDGAGFGPKEEPNLPHPRSFGAFPRALRLFVREKSILRWEDAVYKMTGLPAKILGLERRGAVEKNYFADLIIFDPETFSDFADYKAPRRFAKGIEWLFINGVPVIAEGALSGKFAGRVLRK
ncbi:MAG: amidohydrolase family protein [Candidatus Niyogibacteria bacterium]|nr:amidohydrolase family protein [Candidatus Niyogibacteria bacterium]